MTLVIKKKERKKIPEWGVFGVGKEGGKVGWPDEKKRKEKKNQAWLKCVS